MSKAKDGLRQAFMDELVASPPQEVQCSSETSDNRPSSQLGYCAVNIFGIEYIWDIEYMVLPDDESFVSVYGKFCALFDGGGYFSAVCW